MMLRVHKPSKIFYCFVQIEEADLLGRLLTLELFISYINIRKKLILETRISVAYGYFLILFTLLVYITYVTTHSILF